FMIIAVSALIMLACDSAGIVTGNNTQPPSLPTTVGGGTNNVNGLPAASFKQTPRVLTFQGCPPEGDGGDPVLNRNKNRVDEGNYQPVNFQTILNLRWPQETERTDHASWSAAARAVI